MYQAILDAGWDGEWFLRAYDANSEKVGSSECKEGQIFIEPQGSIADRGDGQPRWQIFAGLNLQFLD